MVFRALILNEKHMLTLVRKLMVNYLGRIIVRAL